MFSFNPGRIFVVRHGSHETIAAIEGLRGLAMLLVFMLHFSYMSRTLFVAGKLTSGVAGFFSQIGYVGIDISFVISGFLIYGHLLERPWHPASYFYRRAARIYPTFLAVFALYLVLSIIVPSQNKLPAGAGDAIIYILQNLAFLPGILEIEPIIAVASPIGLLVLFYALAPLLICLTGMRDWTFNARISLIIFIAIAGFVCCIAFSLPVQMLMFVAGMLARELRSAYKTKLPHYAGIVALIFALAAYYYLARAGVEEKYIYILLFPTLLALCWGVVSGERGTNAILSWPPLRRFGNMSYSYYLIHALVLNASFKAVKLMSGSVPAGAWLYWLMLPVAFGLTLFVSALLFIFVEKPFSLKQGNL
jgi:peptidoglycan/LPS O-acetylase OafA/YrhL